MTQHRKRLFVHIGLHKTGSSALQGWLAVNVEVLRAAGVSYLHPDPATVVATGGCSGNVVQMVFKFGFGEGLSQTTGRAFERISQPFIDQLHEEIMADGGECSILSGEVLCAAREREMEHFHRVFSATHDVRYVCFVRDQFDYVYSSYKQILKTLPQQGHVSFESYIRDRGESESRFRALRQLDAMGADITVLRYETHKRDVVRAFLTAIGFADLAEGEQSTGMPQFNRSLTHSETLMVNLVALRLRNFHFTMSVIRAMLLRPAMPEPAYYNRALHQEIIALFAKDIALVNRYLPATEQLTNELRDVPDSVPAIAPADVELVFNLLRKADKAKSANNSQLVGLPTDTSESKVDLSELPIDFNSEAYFFHNPDVAAAGVDAANHYLMHGRKEGRLYRFS